MRIKVFSSVTNRLLCWWGCFSGLGVCTIAVQGSAGGWGGGVVRKALAVQSAGRCTVVQRGEADRLGVVLLFSNSSAVFSDFMDEL